VQRVPKLRDHAEPRLMQPGHCEKCQGSGFQGQLCVAEVITVDEDIRNAVLRRLPAAEIERMARTKGMASIYEDGASKVWRGLTTIEEVLRVTNSF
jgi:general secretion pathway protein E